MRSSEPIGIFDSGIGGLTVARAIKDALPEERLIYFGDTAHLPYGDKSTAAIQAYSVRIAELLLRSNCKVIVIACNSASSAAFELVKEYVGKKVKVIDVIEPTIAHIREELPKSSIGLIGTKQTVSAGVYEQKIRDLDLDIVFSALATPLLVPMIEEGFSKNHISTEIIKSYLSNSTLSNCQSLILGCTHYPIIKKQINEYYSSVNREVHVIDSAEQVASSLKGYLEFNQLASKKRSGDDEFMVSDFTESFEEATKLFFGKQVKLKKVGIWEELN